MTGSTTKPEANYAKLPKEEESPSPATVYARIKQQVFTKKGCQVCGAISLGLAVVVALFFTYFCHILKEPFVPLEANGVEVSAKYLGGRPTLNYWDLPVQRSPELMAECMDGFRNISEAGGIRWGSLSADEAARLAYKCTKVPGLFEQVPEKLRGVFWMKGNPLPEELAVLQMGQWFPDEQVYIAPFAPFSWGWADGRPADAPFFGKIYTDEYITQMQVVMPMYLLGFSVKFLECPERPHVPIPFVSLPGHACEASGNESEMNYAVLNAHLHGVITNHSEKEHYTIEEFPDAVEPGAKWWRGIYGGHPIMGRCKCVSVGAYQLTKIIDADGNPLQPHFDEWVKYMGNTTVTLWAGHSDETAQELLESDRFDEWTARTKELFCEEGGDEAKAFEKFFGACDSSGDSDNSSDFLHMRASAFQTAV